MKSSRSGQVLIEIIIAALVIVMVSLAVTQLIASSVRESAAGKTGGAATFLAGEELEGVRAVLAQSWSTVTTIGTSSLNKYFTRVNGGAGWGVTAGAESLALNSTTYTRYFYLTDVYRSTSTGAITPTGGFYDPSTIKVNGVVTWTDNFGNPLSFAQVEYLSRFYNQSFSQTDWSGGSAGEVVTSAATSTFATSTSIDATSTPGSIQLSGS